MRALVIYQHFGPYHIARWRHLRAAMAAAGIEALGLQLFARPDLYDWGGLDAPEGVRDLGLRTSGNDRLRWRDAPCLLRALRAAAPDVVVVNGWRTRDALLAHAWCRARRVPRVLVSESVAAPERRGGHRDLLKRAIIHGTGSAFVAGTPQRRYVEALGVPAAAVRQGCAVVDNEHFDGARRLRGSGGRRLLTVARWSPEKNLLAAGEAFLKFVAQRPVAEDWSWSLAGYGPLADALQALAARSAGCIRLLGTKRYAELPAVLAAADLYWQPSLYEPWGLAVNEAMASGLPVLVSTRCGCHEDLVTAATGWTFDPTREAALLQALEVAAAEHQHWPERGEAAAALVRDWGLAAFSGNLIDAVVLAARGVAE